MSVPRACELCERLDEPPQLGQVLYGQLVFHFVRGELVQAECLADEFRRLAHVRKDLASAAVMRSRDVLPYEFSKMVEGSACIGLRASCRVCARPVSGARSASSAVRPFAWTDVGGELLTIEAAVMPGKDRMTVTGNLRDVMKESISAAASYVRMRAVAFGIKPPLFDKRDIHVHVPEGATPKDGPSAGVAMATAIVSVMTGIPVRRDVAMTGEITLRGRVFADRRSQGEAARGLARGHQNSAHSRRERQGSCRNRGQHQEWAQDRSGLAHGRGARPRDDAQAGADRVGRDHDHRSGGARGGPGRGGSLDAPRETAAYGEADLRSASGTSWIWP